MSAEFDKNMRGAETAISCSSAFVNTAASNVTHNRDSFEGARLSALRPATHVECSRTPANKRCFQACAQQAQSSMPSQRPDVEQVRALLMTDRKADQQRGLLLARELEQSDYLEMLLLAVRQSKNEWIRATATVGLGQLHNADDHIRNRAIEMLLDLLMSDSDYSVRAAAAAGCGYLADTPGSHTDRVVEQLIRGCYEDPEWQVQFSCLVSLGNLKDMRAMPVLLRALKSDNDIIVQGAVGAIGEVGDPHSLPPLLDCLDSQDIMTRQRLAHALGSFIGQDMELAVVDALNILAQDKSITVRDAATEVLSRIDGKANGKQGAVIVNDGLSKVQDRPGDKTSSTASEVSAAGAIRRRLQRSFDKSATAPKTNMTGAEIASTSGSSDSKEGRDETGDSNVSSSELSQTSGSSTSSVGFSPEQLNKTGSMSTDHNVAEEYDKLVHDLQSKNLTVRSVAAIGLRKLPVPKAIEAVLEANALKDNSERVRGLIIPLLIRARDVERILEMLKNDTDQSVRAAACDALNEFRNDPSVLPACIDAFESDSHWLVRCTAAIALSNMNDASNRAETALLECLQPDGVRGLYPPEDSVIRRHAITALGSISSTKAVPEFRKLIEFSGTNEMERVEIAACLCNIPSEDGRQLLNTLVKDKSAKVIQRAQLSLQALDEKKT